MTRVGHRDRNGLCHDRPIIATEDHKRGTVTGLASQQNRGAWVTNPVPLESAKKLYHKGGKHAESVTHRFAYASASRQSESMISKLICQGANRKDAIQTDCMKSLFRAAHFLFMCEIPHTTSWRALVFTIAACDSSGKPVVKSPCLT